MTQTLDPATVEPATTTTPRARVDAWLADFEAALAAGDAQRAAGLFATTSFWRDLVAFTWNLTTVEGREGVAGLVAGTDAGASGFHTTEEPTEADGLIDAWIGFETTVGRGRGHLRLLEEGAWTFLTTLYELKGHEESAGATRPPGVVHGASRDRTTWSEQRAAAMDERNPYVVVVGGGQGGIALGARLRQLGVSHVVVDRHARPGDQWRSRYKSLCLHDPVWYDHLPYLDFPRNWPVFAPKDKIADWLESYTRIMEITYWSSTTCRSATFDDDTKEWTVVLDRTGPDGVTEITLHPKQLVLATGMSGKANVPTLPGQDVFRGDQHHSSQHAGPDAHAGRKVVVIGSNNSAFDICGALWEAGTEVTMVQRSSTHIVKSASLMEIGLGGLYSEAALAAGVTTQKADMIFASLPYRIMHTFQQPVYAAIKERDQDFYDRLEASGFRHDWGEDESGLFMKYLRRGSGYYIDVGSAELVASGDIPVVQGQVDHLTSDAVVLDDGTVLPADVVVYATGYGSMNGWAADLISPEVADRVGKVWGLGSDTLKDPGPWEGEQRNMWKPTQQEALWFHGGNLHQSRHYSLYLALQLKARAEGLDTPVYALAEVHHTS